MIPNMYRMVNHEIYFHKYININNISYKLLNVSQHTNPNYIFLGGRQERAADYRLAAKTSVTFFYVYCLVKSMQGSTDLVTWERKKNHDRTIPFDVLDC